MTDAGEPSNPTAVPTPSAPVPSAPIEVELVPSPPNTSDWPSQATETIVNLVDQVRAKTTGPAITVARGLVFGFLVVVLGLMAGILLLVFAVRLTTDLLELIWDGAGVWLTYLIYGVLFTLVGAYVFGKRHVRGIE